MYFGKKGELVVFVVIGLVVIASGVLFFATEGTITGAVVGISNETTETNSSENPVQIENISVQADCSGEATCSCGDNVVGDLSLTGDVSTCDGIGLNVGSSNIEIDCKGFSIIGDGITATNGIFVSAVDGFDNIIIRNCIITNFDSGIRFPNGADNLYSFNNTLISNSNGYLIQSDNHVINQSTITNSGSNGIQFPASLNVTIVNSNISSSGSYDLTVSGRAGGSNHTIYNNYIEGKVKLDGTTTGVKIYNNIFWDVSSLEDLNGNNDWNTTYDCTQTNIKGGPCIGGNFYSNYTGNDSDDDGIGDIDGDDSNGAHNISGAGENQDFLPLVNVYKFTAPITAFASTLDINSTYNLTNAMVDGSNHSTAQNITFIDGSSGQRYLTIEGWFNRSLGASGLDIYASDTKVASDLNGVTGISSTHTLYLNNTNNGDGVIVCPDALHTIQVNASCTNKITFTSQNVTDQVYIDGVNVSIDKNEYKIENLSSSGVMILEASCGTTLTQDTNLTENLTSEGTCFTIGAHNIVVDGQGYSITGDESGDGIDNTGGYDNIAIQNFGLITNFSKGMQTTSMITSNITNNTVSNNTNGIYLSGSSNLNNLTDNIIQFNQRGIYLVGADDNIIENNFILSNTIDGIFVSDSNSQDNILINNNFTGNSDAIEDVSGTTVNNTINYTNSFGSVVWTLEDIDVKSGDLALGTNLIIDNNTIAFNASVATDLNTTANITLNGLSLTDVTSIYKWSNYSDNRADILANAELDCMTNDNCTNVNYANNILTFTSSSFSSFTALGPVQCGDTIYHDTNLTANLTAAGTCITIGNHNIILNGKNFNITGDGTGNGVDNSGGYDNVTIIGFGHIYNFSTGIYGEGTSNSTIFNNTISAATETSTHAIYFLESDNANISNNILNTSGSLGYGIRLEDSQDNTVFSNLINTSGIAGHGLHAVENVTSSTFTNNIVNTFGSGDAIRIRDSSNLTVADNVFNATSTGNGLELTVDAENNTIEDNNISASSVNVINDLTGDSFNNTLSYDDPFGNVTWTIGNLTIENDIAVGTGILIDNNSLALNTSNYLNLNTSATITLKLLNLSDVNQVFKFGNYTNNSTTILANGADCVVTGNCSLVSYNNTSGVLVFETDSFSSFSAAYDPGTECGFISEDTNLTNDVTATSTCFTINANDLTLDCQGYSISGDNSGFDYGVSISSKNNIIIKNCIINDFWRGILAITSQDSTFTNNTLSNNSVSGITVLSFDNSEITNNTIFNNSDNGLWLWSADNNIVEENNFSESAYDIYISGSSISNSLLNNNLTLNDTYSILDVSTTTNSLIYNNSFAQIVWNKTNLSTGMNLTVNLTIFLENNTVGIADHPNVQNLNTSATIQLKQLPYATTPHLNKSGVRCDWNKTCNITSYINNVLTAEISSFSNYTTQANSQPNITNLSFTNEPIYTNTSNIFVNVTVNDDDGENMTINVSWYVDTVNIKNESVEVANGTIQEFNLSLTDYDYNKTQVINITATAYDTLNLASDTVSDTTTVLNTAPDLTTPLFNQSALTTTEDLSMNVTVTDIDNDTADLKIRWYVNGTQVIPTQLIENQENGTTVTNSYITPDDYKKNDTINVSVEADDSTNTTGEIFSTTLTVSNTAPNITNLQTTVTINISEEYYYDYEASDADVTDGIDVLNWTDNSTLFTINFTTGEINFTPTEAQAGTYNINVTVNDTISPSNLSSDIFVLVVSDYLAPRLNITHPEATSYSTNENLPLNYTVNDSNLESCWYNINDGANTTITGCLNTTFNTTIEGSQTLYLYANDSSGNVNSTSVTFSVPTTSTTPTTPGGSSSSGSSGGGVVSACSNDDDCENVVDEFCEGNNLYKKTTERLCQNSICVDGDSKTTLLDSCAYGCQAGVCKTELVEGGSSLLEEEEEPGQSNFENLENEFEKMWPTSFQKIYSMEIADLACLDYSLNPTFKIKDSTYQSAVESIESKNDFFIHEINGDTLKLLWFFHEKKGKVCTYMDLIVQDEICPAVFDFIFWDDKYNYVTEEICFELSGAPTFVFQEYKITCSCLIDAFNKGQFNYVIKG